MDYKLTIIMSNYNQEAYIEKAIKSILSQKVDFLYKVIITDDYSVKDNSRDIINKYVNENENIEAIFADSNGGYLTNILRAKAVTKTKYFCLLDADDYWIDMYFLQRAFDYLEAHDEYTIYEGNVYVLPIDSDDNGKLKCFISNRLMNGTYTKEDYVSGKNIPITQTTGMFFRNVIFAHGIPKIMKDSIGTLSERSFEGDHDRFIMHLKYGKAYYDCKPVGVYRLTPNGIWTRLNKSQQSLINARAYMDYYRFYESNADFFANKAWTFMIESLESKLDEIRNFAYDKKIYTDGEIKNINEIYMFCQNYIDNMKSTKLTLKQKVKKSLQIFFK